MYIYIFSGFHFIYYEAKNKKLFITIHIDFYIAGTTATNICIIISYFQADHLKLFIPFFAFKIEKMKN